MAGEIQLNNGLSFPVSRRRWNQVVDALAYRISPISSKGAIDQIGANVPVNVSGPDIAIPEKSILLVTDDEASALLVGQMIEKKWPNYRFHTTNQANQLPDLLAGVTEEEYPALLILDARTTTLERLHTLQRLKQHPQLCRLPIILLVSPTDSLVTDGYRRQANSVISLQDGYITFSQTIERVCQFWLLTAALPGATKPVTVGEMK